MTDGINTLRYSDFFLAMYFDGGKSCLHRNHSHVLVYMYSGEMVIDEREKTTRLHKGDCAFIRKDFSVQMTKQAWNGEQFKAIFLMFTSKFLRGFYNRLDRDAIPKDAKRDEISLYKLPSNRPDIVSLFESMTPYFDSNIQPTEELLQLKMIEGIYKSRKTKCDSCEKRNAIFFAKTKCTPKIPVTIFSVKLSGRNTSVVQTPFENYLNDTFY